jgi:hypothetical protein
MAVGRDAGTAEAHAHEELFDRFRDRLPKEFTFEREMLRSRCGARLTAGNSPKSSNFLKTIQATFTSSHEIYPP